MLLVNSQSLDSILADTLDLQESSLKITRKKEAVIVVDRVLPEGDRQQPVAGGEAGVGERDAGLPGNQSEQPTVQVGLKILF